MRSVGLQRRTRRRLHLRPRPLDRRDAPGQPRLVGGRARQLRGREPADPLRRSLLRRQGRGRPARLGRSQQGRDPAGRRAAAPAHQPDRADEPGPEAAAAVLVPAARQEGGGGDDRRRPRQRRHRRSLPAVRGGQPARLLGRRLAVRARHLLHLPEHPDHRRRRPPPSRARGSRSRCTCSTNCADWTSQAQLESFYSSQLADLAADYPSLECRRSPTAPTASPGATGPPSRRSSSRTAFASTPTTTTGRRTGSRTARGCSRAPGCRCASPISTAR